MAWQGKGEARPSQQEDINIDEHISFTLAFDEMFHGPNQLPRLRKKIPSTPTHHFFSLQTLVCISETEDELAF